MSKTNTENNKFYIVVLCYNCEQYIEECLQSIKKQNYDNYEVVIIDDASSDNTCEVIRQNINDKFILIENPSRVGPLANHIAALNFNIDNESIVVHLDGDDTFIGDDVLSTLDKAYTNNTRCLASYGNYKSASNNPSICKTWDKNISISQYIAPIGWIFSHVRTFKYGLWKHIDQRKSFYDSNNKIFTSAGDVAIMKAILELSGRSRVMLINKPMYFYRDNTSLNEHNDHLQDQVRCALEIQKKEPYNPLWYGNLEDNIIDIKHNEPTTSWSSSSPTPEGHFKHPRQAPFIKTFKDYKQNKDLAKLINGKTVAYVCSSPHLEHEQTGDYIDSFDIVARVNQNFPIPKHKYENLGKRTDIQVNCCNSIKRKALTDNIDFIKTNKFILCPMIKVWEWNIAENFLENLGLPYDNICDGYLFKAFKEVGTICNTGLAGIIALLNYDIKLYVTGMTFFNMNTFGDIYYEEYHDHQASYGNFNQTPKKQPIPAELRMDIHNQDKQIEFFRRIVDQHYPNKLLLDDYLTKHFVK